MNDNAYKIKYYKGSSHYFVIKLLNSLSGGQKVLDVGASKGYVGKQLSYKGFEMHAVEPQANLVEMENYYSKVFLYTLEEYLKTDLESYDIILLLDVLEHLIDPWSTLKSLVETQNDRCIFIISIPNSGNFYFRFMVLLGQFRYSKRGLLDKTHLRFFTKSSQIELLDLAGLEISEVHHTLLPSREVFHNNLICIAIDFIFESLAKIWDTMFAYQFIFIARKKHGKK